MTVRFHLALSRDHVDDRNIELLLHFLLQCTSMKHFRIELIAEVNQSRLWPDALRQLSVRVHVKAPVLLYVIRRHYNCWQYNVGETMSVEEMWPYETWEDVTGRSLTINLELILTVAETHPHLVDPKHLYNRAFRCRLT